MVVACPRLQQQQGGLRPMACHPLLYMVYCVVFALSLSLSLLLLLVLFGGCSALCSEPNRGVFQ